MIATCVQHHPKRASLLPALLERLPADTVVVTDPDPDGRLPNPWRTYRECLRLMPEAATHLVIVQDDVVPHPDFAAVLPRVVAAKPDRIICLYCGGIPVTGARAILLAQQERRPWAELKLSELVPVVATVWPAQYVHEFLTWADRKYPALTKRSDDGLATEWCRMRGVRPFVTVPSLVDHPDVEASLIGKVAKSGKDHMRVAVASPEGRDILSVDW